jgi:hypothetical protein
MNEVWLFFQKDFNHLLPAVSVSHKFWKIPTCCKQENDTQNFSDLESKAIRNIDTNLPLPLSKLYCCKSKQNNVVYSLLGALVLSNFTQNLLKATQKLTFQQSSELPVIHFRPGNIQNLLRKVFVRLLYACTQPYGKCMWFSKFVSFRLKYKHADQQDTEVYEVKCVMLRPPH